MSIRHQAPFPGGKPAFEYLLPIKCSEVAGLDEGALDVIADKGLVNGSSVLSEFEKRCSKIRFQFSKTIELEVNKYPPLSLVVFEGDFWVRFGSTCSVNGRSFYVPFFPAIDSIAAFPIEEIPEMHEFVNLFRTLGRSVPCARSNWGIRFNGKPMLVNSSSGDWGHIELEWEGALATLFVSFSGDTVLLSRKGKIGIWRHENLFTKRAMVEPIKKTVFLSQLLTP